MLMPSLVASVVPEREIVREPVPDLPVTIVIMPAATYGTWQASETVTVAPGAMVAVDPPTPSTHEVLPGMMILPAIPHWMYTSRGIVTVSLKGDAEFDSVIVQTEFVGWKSPGTQFAVDLQLPTEMLLVDIASAPSLTSTEIAKSQACVTVPAMFLIVKVSLPLSVRTQAAPVTHVGVAAAGAAWRAKAPTSAISVSVRVRGSTAQ
jgi:hypothetical protein